MEEKAFGTYAEEQHEQYVKVILGGTGPKGDNPATSIKIVSENTNDFQKLQALIHMFEWLNDIIKKKESTLSDMLFVCLQACYEKEMGNENS